MCVCVCVCGFVCVCGVVCVCVCACVCVVCVYVVVTQCKFNKGRVITIILGCFVLVMHTRGNSKASFQMNSVCKAPFNKA